MKNIKYIDAIVLSGGGTKGIGQLGVLHYYYEKNILDLDKVIDFAGTSVGSIICLLLICGYTPIEIFSEICDIENFFENADNSIWKLIEKLGLLPIEPIINIVETFVIRKFGYIPTLSKLKELTGKRLIAPAINITKKKVVYFTPETHPDILVTEVCKLSSKLPLIFQQVQYLDDFYEDGGLADNFPIRAIDNDRNVLGVIVTGSNLAGANLPLVNYIYHLIMLPIDTNTFLRCPEDRKNLKIVKMKFEDIPIISINLCRTKKMGMFMEGYKEAEREENKEKIYVKNWHWEVTDGWDVDISDWE